MNVKTEKGEPSSLGCILLHVNPTAQMWVKVFFLHAPGCQPKAVEYVMSYGAE